MKKLDKKSPIQSQAPEYSSQYAVTAEGHCMKIDLKYEKEDASKYTVLLVLRAAFHPQTTQEVFSYSSWIERYKAINCDIVGIVRDSYESIHEWVMAPEAEGGLANTQEFPIICDKSFPGLVSKLGVRTLESYGDNAIIIIDPHGKIRYWAAFPPNVGRGETLHIVESIRKVDRNNGTVLTPADWMDGDPIIPNNHQGIDNFYCTKYRMNKGKVIEILKSMFTSYACSGTFQSRSFGSDKNKTSKDELIKDTETGAKPWYKNLPSVFKHHVENKSKEENDTTEANDTENKDKEENDAAIADEEVPFKGDN